MSLRALSDRLPRPARDLASKVYRQRAWIERSRYLGRPVSAGQAGHDAVRRLVAGGVGAIGKIGESELRGLRSYLRFRDHQGFASRWSPDTQSLYTNAGVFPHNALAFNAFATELLSVLGQVDVLGVWFLPGEASIVRTFAPRAELVGLRCLEPQLWSSPWFELVRDKRLLVVSPFEETIRAQQARLHDVWNKVPAMRVPYELVTLRTPFCAAIATSPYRDWQSGLDILRSQMDALSYDVAIIGAGAWSLPLAVHAKRSGKLGVHLGGGTQLLFGIRGRRWDRHPEHSKYFTDAWVRPSERPTDHTLIEGGCYW